MGHACPVDREDPALWPVCTCRTGLIPRVWHAHRRTPSTPRSSRTI